MAFTGTPLKNSTISNSSYSTPIYIAGASLAIILALVVGVGLASHLVIRHLVQTLPLWAAVVIGLRRSLAVRWIALPMFLFWLFLMSLIWSYLLGISHLINGTFSPIEIAMTMIVGIACLTGIVAFWRCRPKLSLIARLILFVGFAVIQWVCFYVSFLPAFVHR